MPAIFRPIECDIRPIPRDLHFVSLKPAAAEKPRRLLDVGAFFKDLLENNIRNEDAAIITRAAARHVARGLLMPDLVYSRKVSEVSPVWFHFLGIGGSDPDLHEMNQAAKDAAGKSDVILIDMRLSPAADPYLAKWVVHIRTEEPAAHAKLAKMSFADMCGVAQRFQWSVHRRGQKAIRHHLRSCPVIHRYEDGWSWVWLETDEQRDAEGEVMDHCVGKGDYDDLGPESGLFSLRDPEGQPTVTAQIRSGYLAHHETGTGAPHHRVLEPRLLELAKRCGSHMSLHGRPGWATDEETAAEEVGRRDRKRVKLRKGLADEEYRLASHLAEPSADPSAKDRRELFELALRRGVYALRLELAELDGLPKPEVDPVLEAFDERRRATWAGSFSSTDIFFAIRNGRPVRFLTVDEVGPGRAGVPERAMRPRPERRAGELVDDLPRWSFENVEASFVAVPPDPGLAIRRGDVVMDEFGGFAGVAMQDIEAGQREAPVYQGPVVIQGHDTEVTFRNASLRLEPYFGVDYQTAVTEKAETICNRLGIPLEEVRDNHIRHLQRQMAENEAQVLQPTRQGFSWTEILNLWRHEPRDLVQDVIDMKAQIDALPTSSPTFRSADYFNPIFERPRPERIPVHLQDRNPRSARQARRMGAHL